MKATVGGRKNAWNVDWDPLWAFTKDPRRIDPSIIGATCQKAGNFVIRERGRPGGRQPQDRFRGIQYQDDVGNIIDSTS
ncbi:hypothetical protein ACLOJK_020418 [Asimina triloba]